jgi:hypothetical protein
VPASDIVASTQGAAMNRIELPVAVRLTAAAFAVFMTITMLDGMVWLAEPEQSRLYAHSGGAHGAAVVPDAPQRVAVAAQLPARHH